MVKDACVMPEFTSLAQDASAVWLRFTSRLPASALYP
jgi:hypothetical protein